MRAQQPSLEQRDGQVDFGKQVFSQFVGLTDHLVAIANILQPAVAFPSVGLNERPRFHALTENGQQIFRRCVGNANHPYPPDLLPVSLGGNHHHTLARRSSPPLAGTRSANEDFIDFDHPAQMVPTRAAPSPGATCAANSMRFGSFPNPIPAGVPKRWPRISGWSPPRWPQTKASMACACRRKGCPRSLKSSCLQRAQR
jgi:hypothetical protein